MGAERIGVCVCMYVCVPNAVILLLRGRLGPSPHTPTYISTLNTCPHSPQLAGCRVVILGGGKVAVDTATRLAAAGAASTAVVFKQVGGRLDWRRQGVRRGKRVGRCVVSLHIGVELPVALPTLALGTHLKPCTPAGTLAHHAISAG